jgi:hypothetical protein
MDTTDVVTFDAPVLAPADFGRKWDREYAAFRRLLPGLLAAGWKGEYVAIHDGAVVGRGRDKLVLAAEVGRQYGPVEILVRLVTDEPRRVVRIPSFRKAGGGG